MNPLDVGVVVQGLPIVRPNPSAAGLGGETGGWQHLQHEIRRRETCRDIAGELDLELLAADGVGTGVDDRVGARYEPADLTRMIGREGSLSDPMERLVAGMCAIGVDAGQIDLVLAVDKSLIALRREKLTWLSFRVLKS
jgi:hypothetical protein